MFPRSLKQWRNRELAEAERLPPGERWKLNEHIYRQQIGLGTLQMLPFAIVFGCVLGVAPSMLGSAFSTVGLPPAAALPVLMVAALGIQITAMMWYYQRYGQRIVWRALNKCDCRTCEACGYDCRATPMEQCPECGASLAKAAPFIQPPDGPDGLPG